MHIWQLDPANTVNFYSTALVDALARAHAEPVRYFSSRFIYDAEAPVPQAAILEDHFFPLLKQVDHTRLAKNARRRQFIRGISYPFDLLRLLIRIYRAKPDIVHIQWAPVPLLDRLFMRAARALGAKVVYTVHDILPHDVPNPHRAKSIYGPLYAAADAIIVHAARNKQELLSYFPDLAATPIFEIPHGPLFEAQVMDYESARARLGVNAPTVLFFGAVKPYKGLDMLLEAFPQVLARVPDARLVIAGKATEEAAAGYERKIAALGLSECTQTTWGFIPTGEVGVYYCAADVVTLPYQKVYQSGNLMTALTMSRPVVVTDVGGLGEVVEAGQCGLIVPPESPEVLAEAIITLLSDPEYARQLGQNGRSLIEDRMSWAAIAAATLQAYTQILAND